MGLVSELRRRNVLRMAVLYVIAAWLIMQVAEVLMSLAGLPAWAGRTILIVLAVGFPIAVAISWFYELTSQGVKLEKDIDPTESITHVTGRRLDFFVISLLCAAVILFAYDKWWMPEPPPQSIAVLPFVNMSDDPGNEYFSDGISEELLNLLARIPQLTVISPSSSFLFRGKDIDIPSVAEQLNVAYVLQGSVRKDANRVRITAQLIDARSDSHLWSDTYDRELENIFDVQDEISIDIVEALKKRLRLKVDAAPRVNAAANTEAYEAFLRGRHLVAQRTPAIVERAIREFEKAIALDPEYAIAHAELSRAILFLLVYDGRGAAEVVVKAARYAEQAMTLDPTLAEVYTAAGFVWTMQDNPEEARAHYHHAIQINPNYSWAYLALAQTLDELGRYAEAFPAFEMALSLDPLSIPAIANYGNALIQRKRLDEVAREMEKLNAMVPVYGAYLHGSLTSIGGKWANMILADLDSLRMNPEPIYGRRRLNLMFATIGLEREAFAIWDVPRPDVLRVLGRPEDAVTAAEEILGGEYATVHARRDLGLALASAGDYARARPILEEMWQRSGGFVTSGGKFLDHHAAALIAIRRDAGEEARVGELIAAIRDNVRRYREAGITADGPTGIRRPYRRYDVDYEEGLADFLAGERETGLVLIAKAAEDGYFIPLWEAYLQTLYDDPGFAPIRAGQKARQAREREKFLTIVCTDNPYAAVWQPAEGTCEQFAAAGGN
jgi:TolB-like protein/Tfp pilus assembly protein PilF